MKKAMKEKVGVVLMAIVTLIVLVVIGIALELEKVKLVRYLEAKGGVRGIVVEAGKYVKDIIKDVEAE